MPFYHLGCGGCVVGPPHRREVGETSSCIHHGVGCPLGGFFHQVCIPLGLLQWLYYRLKSKYTTTVEKNTHTINLKIEQKLLNIFGIKSKDTKIYVLQQSPKRVCKKKSLNNHCCRYFAFNRGWLFFDFGFDKLWWVAPPQSTILFSIMLFSGGNPRKFAKTCCSNPTAA